MEARFKNPYFAVIFFFSLVGAAIYLSGNRGGIIAEETAYNNSTSVYEEIKEHDQKNSTLIENDAQREEEVEYNTTSTSCDLSSGKWVYDEESLPLYDDRKCSFMLGDFSCLNNGRTDLKYQNWRWKPRDCDLPRFNATALMEKIRGKKMLFVGDSLGRNQYVSMLCMIESALPPSDNKSIVKEGNLFRFQSTEYNSTIGFYWSPFLVESNNDDPYIHRLRDRVIRIHSIEKHARQWTDSDILIFDSFMWWLEPTVTILWGSFGSTDSTYRQVDAEKEKRYRIYEMGLNTWSDWLEFNINQTKTKMFFTSLSPYHIEGEILNDKQNCYNVTEPIMKEEYWGAATDREIMRVAESALQKLETRGIKVQYLNITRLSDYRKDGHPSIYREFFHEISEEQLKNPSSYSDCVHWCLPGVPDVWNHILYDYIFKS